MTNYTKTTDFAAKDALPSGNAAKIVKGSEIDAEFDNIATSSATKANKNNSALTGTTTFETISDGTIAITAFVDEDNMASDSATLVPTQQSVKAYVDSQVTAQDLDFQADTGGALSIDLDSETITFTGGTGIDTSGALNAVTFAIDSTVATLTGTQTLSNKTLSTPAVSGNLTTDGLIDGRDVATDGTKLDGIEASADVTDTANVTAAGALMDSELTSEASVKALNQGVATTDSPTFAGVTAPITGNVTGDLTGSVLTAAQTNITSVGTLGSLTVSGDVTVDTNSLKVDSTNNRVGVGTASPSKNVHISSGVNDTPTTLRLENTDTSINTAQEVNTIDFYSNDASTFGTGVSGKISQVAENQGTNYGLAFSTYSATLSEAMRIDASGKVGIGTSSPSTALTVSGAITTDGLTTTADVSFGDNDKAIFGAGSDLQIYHSGSASIIEDTGTGDLVIKGTDLYLRNASNSNRLYAGTDTRLYYDGNEKIRTTSTGIDVTGTATMDGLQVTNAATTGTNQEVASFRTASGGGLVIRSSDLSSANPDSILETFFGESLKIKTSGNDRFKIQDNGDISFYNSAGTSQSLFWDASAESLGIGTSTPDTLLELVGADPILTIRDTETSGAATNATLRLAESGASDTLNNYWDINHTANSALSFKSQIGATASEAMRIDSAGDLTVKGGRIKVRESDDGNDAVVITRDADEGYVNVYSSGTQTVEIRGNGNSYFNGGNLGIGTSSPTKTLVVNENDSECVVVIKSSDTGSAGVYLGGQSDEIKAGMILDNSTNALIFRGYNNAERLRISSAGNLLVGTTSSTVPHTLTSGSGGAMWNSSSYISIARTSDSLFLNRIGSDGGVARFYRNGGTDVGSISVTSSATSYNTSSDQRLKENIADADDAGSKVDAIQVRKFDWIVDGSHQDYGMIAQELQSVAPEAVTGDADSDEMMGVDYSKLVPMLVKEIQSLRARVAQLEN